MYITSKLRIYWLCRPCFCYLNCVNIDMSKSSCLFLPIIEHSTNSTSMPKRYFFAIVKYLLCSLYLSPPDPPRRACRPGRCSGCWGASGSRRRTDGWGSCSAGTEQTWHGGYHHYAVLTICFLFYFLKRKYTRLEFL